MNTAFHLPAASGQNALQFTMKAFPTPNTAPVANAGANQTVSGGSTVTLNGSGTDADQTLCFTATLPCPTPPPDYYRWTQTSGPAVTLSDPLAQHPTFAAPAGPATLGFTLEVGDGGAVTYNGTPATTAVTVGGAPNVPPVANAAANQTVNEGAAVTLNGSASTDPDGGPSPLTYSWTQTAGPAATLAGATTSGPTFTAPAIAWPTPSSTLTFQLTVSDGAATNAASVNVVVNNVNVAPVANAGPAQSVASAAPVTLTGSGSSDPDGGPTSLTYKWTQTAGPAVTLSSSTAVSPTLTAPAGPSSLTFSLVVNDGAANSAPSTVIITVSAPGNVAPVANAGANQTVNEGAGVTLNGSASSDPDGGPSPLAYSWTQTAGPAVTLTGATTSGPTFTAPAVAAPATSVTLTLQLTVSDDAATDAASVNVVVNKVSTVTPGVAGDYTGDGKADPAFFNSYTGFWSIHGRGLIAFGNIGDIPTPGDYNGDKITDLSTFTPATSIWFFRARTWGVKGQPSVSWPYARGGDIPVPADYNGDGRTDQALFRPSTNQWFFNPASSTGVTFGVANAVPVPADYNGDGTADIAFYDPATGAWKIGNGTAIASVTVKSFGGPGYIPVPANYDGVAGADLGLYHPSDGKWFLNGNLTSPAGSGLPGDVPATADFNGDGRQDIARYRFGLWLVNENHSAVFADTAIV